jgi:manganese/zinc/iron transport system permease protein
MSAVVIFSLLFAPRRGVLVRLLRRSRQKWRFAAEALAVHLLNHEGAPEEVRESALVHLHTDMRWNENFARRAVRWAVIHDLVTRLDGRLKLTPYGRETARRVMSR